MLVKDKKELPKYLRIEGDFRSRIEGGRLKDGDMLPDERTLAGQLGCNRLTVNKAYNLLQEKGYVHKVQGSGVYVGQRGVEEEHAGLFAGTRKILGLAMPECVESSSIMRFKEHVFDVFRSRQFESLHLGYVNQAELRRRILLYHDLLEGLVFLACDFDAIAANYRLFGKTGRPMLVAGLEYLDQLNRFESDVVFPDNAGGGALAAEYFLRRGHRKLAVVCLEAVNKRHSRISGFVEHLRREGVRPACVIPELDASLRSHPSLRNKLTGALAAKMAMAAHTPPTAIYCLNDSLAVGAHEQLKAMGVRCPGEVELLGCGGDAEAAIYYQDGVIPVSTVNTPQPEFGAAAAATLLARLEKPNAPRQVVTVGMSILHRQTTVGDYQTRSVR